MAKDGVDALRILRTRRFDLVLLDVWMPRMTGLDLLERLQVRKARPRIVVMTSDDTPETLLKAVRRQAFTVSCHKPVEPAVLLEAVQRGAHRPRAAADRSHLGAPGVGRARGAVHARSGRTAAGRDGPARHEPRPKALEERIAYAFRELLLNAIEWGGKLDPSRKVRIACLRSDAPADVPHRRSRARASTSTSCRTPPSGRPADVPIAHVHVREKQGAAAGRIRTAHRARQRGRADLQREAERGRVRHVPRRQRHARRVVSATFRVTTAAH